MKQKLIPILDNAYGKDDYSHNSEKWDDGTQLFGYEFTRDIVSRIAEKLEHANIKYRVLVPEIINISERERTRRVNRIIDENEGCGFVVSIQIGDNEEKGWRVLTCNWKTQSKNNADIFAECWKYAINGALMEHRFSDDDILTKTKCQSYITKNLSCKSQSDCEYLLSEDGREAIAEYHTNAIIHLIR